MDVLLNSKQFEAFDVLTDYGNGISELLYGGGARGGKSWLGCFWQITRRMTLPGSVGFVCRYDLVRLNDTTKVTMDEVIDFLGLSEQVVYKAGAINSYFFKNGSRIFMRALKPMPRDPNYNRLGSYSITDLFVDESQEVEKKAIDVLRGRFSLLSGTYTDGSSWQVKPKAMYSCNPSKGWNYTDFVKPDKEGTLEPFRKFIKALPIDNPHVSKSYIENLLRSDKITIKRLYYGDFEYDDDPSALCDFDAISDLFHNEHIKEVGGKSMSADIATKGHDRFIGGVWTGNVCRIKIDEKYSPGDVIVERIKEQQMNDSIPRSLTVVDADGVGNIVGDFIKGVKEFHGGSRPIDSRYANLRAECYFKLAELINKRVIRVICTDEQRVRLVEEIGILKQIHVDNDTMKKDVLHKEDMKKLLGRSPDYMDMLMMAMVFRIKKPTNGATARVKQR